MLLHGAWAGVQCLLHFLVVRNMSGTTKGVLQTVISFPDCVQSGNETARDSLALGVLLVLRGKSPASKALVRTGVADWRETELLELVGQERVYE